MEFTELKHEIDAVINQKELDKLIYETEKSFNKDYEVDFEDELEYEF
jgi:hypothetical protein